MIDYSPLWYTMEEKQEMYEYATGQQKSDTVNLGMDVTVPTKPGDTVSVFDLFYGNIKGKFLALFMVIFAVLYSTADMTSGFIKNIAGQVRDRRGLVFAKGVSLFVYTVLTMLIFTGIQTISNALFFDELFFDVLFFLSEADVLSETVFPSSYPRYFSNSEADITVVSAFCTASVDSSDPFAFMPENASAAITAAAGIIFVQGTLGVPFSAGFLSFNSFSMDTCSPLFLCGFPSGICSVSHSR